MTGAPEDDDADVVVAHQSEVRVFSNASGGVTIKSEDHLGTEQLIAFAPGFAEPIVRAIRAAARDAQGLQPVAPDQSLIDRAFAAPAPQARTKVVLVALAFHADAERFVRLSVDDLVSMTCLGSAAVAEVLSDLEGAGWLSAELDPFDYAAPRSFTLLPEAWV